MLGQVESCGGCDIAIDDKSAYLHLVDCMGGVQVIASRLCVYAFHITDGTTAEVAVAISAVNVVLVSNIENKRREDFRSYNCQTSS